MRAAVATALASAFAARAAAVSLSVDGAPAKVQDYPFQDASGYRTIIIKCAVTRTDAPANSHR